MTEFVEDKAEEVKDNDPTLILVRGNFQTRKETTDHVKRVASAIYSCMKKHETAHLRSVGAAATNNSVKAVAIATGELAKQGVDIATITKFQTVRFDTEEKTAMLIKVISLED